MTNPNRLYETERKRQQRARKQAGRTNKVSVYLTDHELDQAVGWSITGDAADGLKIALAYAEDPNDD